MTLINLVQQHYQATDIGDTEAIFANFVTDFRWTETAGSFNGGTYHGPQAVVENVFAKIDQKFTDFQFIPNKFIEGENQLVVIGHYQATVDEVQRNVATVHYWQGTTNGIESFEQFTDSATLNSLSD